MKSVMIFIGISAMSNSVTAQNLKFCPFYSDSVAQLKYARYCDPDNPLAKCDSIRFIFEIPDTSSLKEIREWASLNGYNHRFSLTKSEVFKDGRDAPFVALTTWIKVGDKDRYNRVMSLVNDLKRKLKVEHCGYVLFKDKT